MNESVDQPVPEPWNESPTAPPTEPTIELAREEDLGHLPEIERRAARLFSPEDLPPEVAARTMPPDRLRSAQREQRLWVAREEEGGRPVGFALLGVRRRDACLEEIDVDPDHGRRGLGRRLVETVRDAARARGHDRLLLATFRDVPWNAPFYARLGFEIVERIGEGERDAGLRAMRREDVEAGLDPSRRVLMRLAL